MSSEPVLALKGVSKYFERKQDLVGRLVGGLSGERRPPPVRAVDAVDLEIRAGEVLGLVGESGCGKSTLGRMAAGIIRPSKGSVEFCGKDIWSLDPAAFRAAKLKVQMIFQDTLASLNPRLPVSELVGEAPRAHRLVDAKGFGDYVDRQLARTQLDPTYKRRYAHQFSGGQRQRIGIARALAVQPEVLVCDEAVASLDVSIKAQIINLFIDLRASLGLTYLFISHDLGIVQHLSDEVAVMYLGRIVERAPTAEIFSRPHHPYSRALLAELPRIYPGKRRFEGVKGEVPSPLAPPPGCHFHTRCPHAMPICREVAPPLKQVAAKHLSACHLNG